MEMIACQSSNVQEFGYDAEARILAIRFKNGLYHYKDVPPEIFEALGRAESVGKFVNGHVVGHFASEKINEQTDESGAASPTGDRAIAPESHEA